MKRDGEWERYGASVQRQKSIKMLHSEKRLVSISSKGLQEEIMQG